MLPPAVRAAPKGKSNRTRIETTDTITLTRSNPRLRKENPIEQGLKRATIVDDETGEVTPKGKSNRTRIETSSATPHSSQSGLLRKENPIEQGLKRHIGKCDDGYFHLRKENPIEQGLKPTGRY